MLFLKDKSISFSLIPETPKGPEGSPKSGGSGKMGKRGLEKEVFVELFEGLESGCPLLTMERNILGVSPGILSQCQTGR